MARKETVLDESASIYQTREEKSEKQKWSEMGKKEKWQYFNEYYRNKLILLIVGVVAGVWLLYSVVGPSVESVLYVAVINDYWNDTASEALELDLKEYVNAHPKWEEVIIDDSYYFQGDSSTDASQYVQKLAAYIFAGDIDIIVANEEQFEVYATQDYFSNLQEILPADLYDLVEDSLVYYTSENDGKTLPVGIRLGDSKVYASMNNYQESPLLGIMGNSDYIENAVAAVRYFFTEEVDYSQVQTEQETQTEEASEQ